MEVDWILGLCNPATATLFNWKQSAGGNLCATLSGSGAVVAARPVSHLCFDHISVVTCRPLKELTQRFRVNANVFARHVWFYSDALNLQHLGGWASADSPTLLRWPGDHVTVMAAIVQADSTNEPYSGLRKAPNFAEFFQGYLRLFSNWWRH